MQKPCRNSCTVPSLLGALTLAAVLPANAQSPSPQPSQYPTKPVRYLVGFSAGTATDIVARLISQKLSERWGQQFIVDNRVGAAGTISVAMAARAEPDGYTLYMASATMVSADFFVPGVTYDVFRDFAPVILMAELPTVLIVPPQLGLNSVKDLIALAKSKPGALNYAHSGQGTGSHIAAELLRSIAGIDLQEVSFKISGDALNAIIRGDVAVYYPNLAAALPLIRQGRVKALAVSSARRSSVAPDLPPMSDTVPGFDVSSFYGIVVPARTPKAVIARLNAAVAEILQDPGVRDKLLGLGADVVAGSPESLTKRMQFERDQVTRLVKDIEARERKVKAKG
ncbi:MAG: Bug family tripartite tricarboxylate transporter substrate binding protein [Burkholderiales bacterium]